MTGERRDRDRVDSSGPGVTEPIRAETDPGE